MPTSNLSDTWSRRALLDQAEQRAPQPDGASTALDRLNLTPSEVRCLSQKFGAKPTWSKSILNLVPLENPLAGWRVLIGIVRISPELARQWLKTNFRNRKVSDATVEAYARDAKTGNWIPTHQGVAFNDSDQLIDGQHRLLAIIKSGIPLDLLVSFGWPTKVPGKQMTTMDAVDRGRTRSVGDQLTIQHGLPDGRVIAGVCAQLANLCCSDRVRCLSVGNTLEVFHQFKDPLHWVVQQRSKQTGLRSAGVLAAFTLAIAGAKPELVSQLKAWFVTLNTGKGLPAASALAKLRAFLVGEENSLFRPGMNRGLAILTCQALFMELNHRPGKDLAMVEEGAKYWKRLQPDRVSHLSKLFEL
jgi:hypothetical protein